MRLSDFDVKCAFVVKEAFKRNLIILVGSLASLTGIELLAWTIALEEVASDIRLTCNLGSLSTQALPTSESQVPDHPKT